MNFLLFGWLLLPLAFAVGFAAGIYVALKEPDRPD